MKNVFSDLADLGIALSLLIVSVVILCQGANNNNKNYQETPITVETEQPCWLPSGFPYVTVPVDFAQPRPPFK